MLQIKTEYNMKSRKKGWIWILLAALILVAAVVVYMAFPLHRNGMNRKAVAGQAATYYDALVGELTDSINAPEAQRAVEGD